MGFTQILETGQSIVKKVKNRLQGSDMARNINYSFKNHTYGIAILHFQSTTN